MKIRKYKKLYEDDAQQPVANATPAQPAAQQPATNTSTTIDASAPDWNNISKQVSDNLSAVLIDQIPKIVLKIIPNYGQMPEFKNAVNVWNKFKNDKTLTSFTEYMKEFYTDIDTINTAERLSETCFDILFQSGAEASIVVEVFVAGCCAAGCAGVALATGCCASSSYSFLYFLIFIIYFF
jgi:hypothetical protein